MTSDAGLELRLVFFRWFFMLFTRESRGAQVSVTCCKVCRTFVAQLQVPPPIQSHVWSAFAS